MIDRERLKEILDRLSGAAQGADLLIAPIGSGYFFVHHAADFQSKDVDAVVHAQDLSVADLDAVVAMAKLLGPHEVSQDRAVVTVYLDGPKGAPQTKVVELIRGRPRGNDGFLPRPLLAEAGRQARRDGRVLWYKPEFVLVMKADAAVDRQERADRGGPYAEQNLKRAQTFRADVLSRVPQMGPLSPTILRDALDRIKQSRRQRVADLIEAASGGRTQIR